MEVDPPAAVLLSDTPDEVTRQATAPCGGAAVDSEDTNCFAAALATSLRLVGPGRHCPTRTQRAKNRFFIFYFSTLAMPGR